MSDRPEPSPRDRARRRVLGAVCGTALLGGHLPGGIGGGAARAQERGIVGRAAPELDVPLWRDADGEPSAFSIAEARGRWVFLKCFQYWCPGCHSSGFPTLQAMQKAFGDHPKVALAAIQTVFEGFGTNVASRLPEIRERYALTMPIGHDAGDPDGEGLEKLPTTLWRYRTGGTPWLVLIDPRGTVVFNDFHVDRERLVAWLEERLESA